MNSEENPIFTPPMVKTVVCVFCEPVSGRRRNTDDRQNGARDQPFSHVVPERSAVGHKDRERLGEIHGTSAPNGQQGVKIRSESFPLPVHIRTVRFCGHFRESLYLKRVSQ